MMTIIFTVLVFAIPGESYNTGNSFYSAGNFSQAIEAYENALQNGPNKKVYYNLGNAYFKAGKIGKALIQYRRAWLIDPRDSDVNYNISFVRSYRVDKSQSVLNPFANVISSTFHFFSINEAGVLAALLLFSGTLLISLFFIFRYKALVWAACAAYVLFVFFFITLQIWQAEKSPVHAVITMSEVSAFSGPGDEHKEILVIHDGTEVRIRSERGGYFLIQLPGGIGGWVKAENVERIFGVKSSHLTL